MRTFDAISHIDKGGSPTGHELGGSLRSTAGWCRAAPRCRLHSLERGDQIKVSFFGVPQLPQLAPVHVIEENNLKVASLLDLAGTKASVIQVRAEAKDYLDLDALMRLGEVDLATALPAAHALYGPTFNPEVTLKARLGLSVVAVVVINSPP